MEIIKYGNPILRKKAKSINKIDKSIRDLIVDMFDIMHNSTPKGVGLAAPQIGLPIQLIVIETEPNKQLSLINPEIIESKGKDTALEGCLSIPGVWGNVIRAKKIKVRGINPNNSKKIILEAEGILARAIQHEVDHLNGILFTDYIEKIEDLCVDEGFVIPEKLRLYYKKRK
ncbi:MAG: peptide deformylase [Caldisericia bacterium]|nr:peptide deformylase [Caldisericia bacterium]